MGNALMILRWVLFGLAAVIATSASAPPDLPVDLTRIGHISSKGRVQDSQYNNLPVVNSLIQAGPAAIPFLVGKLDDDTEIREDVLDFWPRVTVGDVALVILCDLFRTADWKASTVPGLEWDALLERTDPEAPGWVVLQNFLAHHGRRGLRERVEELLKPYEGSLAWDANERCFMPIK